MGFEEFLPAGKSEELEEELKEEPKNEKISPNQFYDVITSRKPDWQQIIYDLINSEQLDPWDIDLVILTKKYFEKIAGLEEADFYISSRVLLAASLLLRIKSEFLLNKYIKSIDEILFGKKDEKKYMLEKIEINEDELPLLIPKTPLARLRKVTLSELLSALNQAIETESRRIKKEVSIVRAKKLSEIDFPSFKRIDLKDRIKQFYAKILTFIKKKAVNNEKSLNKVGFSSLVGKEKEEKLACFLPLLHLSNSQRLWIEQEKHLDEIWVYLYDYFEKNRDKFLEDLEKDIEEMKQELNENFNPEELAKIEVLGEIVDEVKKEVKNTNKEEKIDKITGFSDENL